MKKLIAIIALFSCVPAGAQSVYGGLETWRNFTVATSPGTTLEAPIHWNVTDSVVFYAQGLHTSAIFKQQVYQSTDAHSGNLAAKLMTMDEDTLHLLPALMTNADIGLDFSSSAARLVFSGGTPVTSRVPSVSAWVKYYPRGTDSGFIRVEAIKSGLSTTGGDSVIGSGSTYITGLCTTYTMLTAPVTYADATTTPDLLRIFISSSGNAPQDSSTLYVDDINMSTVGINSVSKSNSYYTYPVPAADFISFHGSSPLPFVVSVVSADGRNCGSYTLIADEQLDLSAYPAGCYFYTLVNNSEGITERGTFQLCK